MYAFEVSFQVISIISFICLYLIIGQKISFDSNFFGLDIQPSIGFDMKSAPIFVGKHQLPLNSPNHFSWIARPTQRSGYLGWLPQVGGSLDGFQLRWWTSVENIESLTTECTGGVVFTAFTNHLSQVFGIEDGVIFWRDPILLVLLVAIRKPATKNRKNRLKLRCHLFEGNYELTKPFASVYSQAH